MKKKIKLFLSFVFVIFAFSSTVFAAEINLRADKLKLSTDDEVNLYLSVDGQVDNNQIAISGLDKFDIIGRSTSQRVSIINGKTNATQEQVFTLQPKTFGKIKVVAIAKENGKEIKSKEIVFDVQKSYLQNIKDNLLNNTNTTNSANQIQNKEKDDLSNESQNQKEDDLKKLLLKNQNQGKDNTKIKDEMVDKSIFPKIEKISPFNSQFWLEFLGIIALLVLILVGLKILKNKK